MLFLRDNYCRQGFSPPYEDIFTLEVLVRMSDIAETAHNSKWNLRQVSSLDLEESSEKLLHNLMPSRTSEVQAKTPFRSLDARACFFMA